MILAEGTRVELKFTGDRGVVTELLEHDMVMVLLDDGDEIPVAIGDLTRPDEAPKIGPRVKAKLVTLPPKPDPLQQGGLPEADSQYMILKSRGVQLAFLPHPLPDGTTPHFEMFLINDTQYSALFTFQLITKQREFPKINGKLEATSAFPLGNMAFGILNDLPEAKVEVWQIKTMGTGKPLRRTLKVRAKQFFSKVITAPILNKAVHHYVLFDSFDPPSDGDRHEDLKAYTKANVRPPRFEDSDHYQLSSREVREYAEFDTEIDLHIENLTDKDYRKMRSAEILRIQLSAFESYLDRAIAVGVDRVFIIHGLGKGKLRNDIATRLMKHPEVKTFKNEYHPNYGYGATEVILR